MSETPSPPRLLFVGSHSAVPGVYESGGQQVGHLLAADAHDVLFTSMQTGASAKMRDILATMIQRRHEYDVVVIEVFSTRAFWYARLGSRLAKRLGKQLVLVLKGGNLPRLAEEHPERVRRVLERADRIVSPSDFLAREVGQRLGFEVAVIPNPVPQDTEAVRLRGPIAPKLLWVRAFERTYNPLLAIEVLARLLEHDADAQLVMAGPDKDGSLAAVKAQIDALGLQDCVRIAGLVPKTEVRALASEADLFLNTTNVDNAPRSVVEAMAQGLCVVSTNVGGVPDLFTDSEGGLLVPPNDAAAMTKAVERLLKDEVLARRISVGGRNAATRSRPDQVRRAWGALLDSLEA